MLVGKPPGRSPAQIIAAAAPGEVVVIVPERFRVGESPIWDSARQQLWWCDILARRILRIDLRSGERRSWTMPSEVASLGLCQSGKLMVALRRGVHVFDPEKNRLELLVNILPAGQSLRLNDGKIGPDGAFWVGSMDDRPKKEPIATLYRVTADGTVKSVAEGVIVSNGLAWSADGTTMFHSDSRGAWIDRYRFNPATGIATGRHRLVTLDEKAGRPDGGATDLEGGYWSCGVSAGVINRFSADGRLIEKLDASVPAPTMPCFGGPDMRTLFFTSLSEGQSPEVLARHQFSGAVFAVNVHVPGVAVGRFCDEVPAR